MKFIFSQMAFFLTQKSNRRNLKFMRNFFIMLLSLILLYSIIFHYLMEGEGRSYSGITGLYWAITVMSTLGFGDITFQNDPGKIFTIIVMLSGIVLIMLIMPFTFIRFIYVPWLEAQTSAMTPRKLSEALKGHAILVGSDDIALSIASKLKQYEYPYCMLVDDVETAFSLYDQGYTVVQGDLDDIKSYNAVKAQDASLVFALKDDLKNTNIAATVREVAPKTLIGANSETDASQGVLALAGCDKVFNFPKMLGHSLARRVFNSSLQCNIIGSFENLCIAEAKISGRLAGKNIKELNFSGIFGLNIVGMWQGREYLSVHPDTVVGEGSILLLSGTEVALDNYNKNTVPSEKIVQPPVVILGGGRVGKAVGRTLDKRGIDFRLLDKNSKVLSPSDSRHIVGDASEYSSLQEAGIEQTQTVLVTTHNDDLNIYLSIYCKKLRPDIQIISRATLDKNISSLYAAGATLVMSQASFTANSVINLLNTNQVFTLTEGLNVFRTKASDKLIGKNLIESGIRKDTGCNVVAISSNGTMQIPPDPRQSIVEKDEMVIIGTVEQEAIFRKKY